MNLVLGSRWPGWRRSAAPPCAFICGCGHSGTSIMMAILAAHPEIYVPARETGAFLGSRREAWLKSTSLFKEHAASGRRVLVEKTPRHIRRLDRIRELASGAKFILPVRDGRDVAVSIQRREGSLAAGQERWILDTAIVAEQAGRADCLTYRYEDFVDNPRATVERICKFIGVPFVLEMMAYHRTPRHWFDQTTIADASPATGQGHLAHRNWQINQPLFDGRGKWRSKHAELDFPALTSGDGLALMREFGYA